MLRSTFFQRDHALELDALEAVVHDEFFRANALADAPPRPEIVDEFTPGKGASVMPPAPGAGLSAGAQGQLAADRESANPTYSFREGVSDAARKKMQEVYGFNKLTPAKQTPEWLKFLSHLSGFFSLLLWGGAILCFFGFFLRGDLDNLYLGIVLSAVVLITGIFSYIQDAKADGLMDQFASLMENTVEVRKTVNGVTKFHEISATDLVRGDIIKLASGDVVPADIRIIESNNLGVSNAPLTGEPDDIEMKLEAMALNTSPQDFNNTCFFGTNVTKGSGIGCVSRIGDDTFMGMVALLTMNTKAEETPISKEIKHFISIVSGVAIVLGVGFFMVGVFLDTDLITNLVFAIGIIVANVPEGLLATVTVCLSLTAKSMATQMVLVKNMEGVETLGSTTCICSDKTGTLTQNMMTFANLVYDAECFESELVHPDVTHPLPQCDRSSPTFNLFLDCIKLNTTALFAPEDVAAAGSCEDPLIYRNNQKYLLFKQPVSGEVPKLVGWKVKGDASESAMVRFAQYMSFPNREAAMLAAVDKVVERRGTTTVPTNIAFSSALKYHMMLRRDPTNAETPYTVYLKGAAERVLERCDKVVMQGEVVEMTPHLRAQINDRLTSMMAKGRRCLGFSYLPLDGSVYKVNEDGTDYEFVSTDTGRNFPMGDNAKNCEEVTAENEGAPEHAERQKGLIFVGIACLIDPPRPAVPKAVVNCQQAGIRVVMVTGDHPLTARAIAKLVNIVGKNSEVFDEVIAKNCAAGWPDFGPKATGPQPKDASADTAADAAQVLTAVLKQISAAGGCVPDDNLDEKERPKWLAVAIAKANARGGASPSDADIAAVVGSLPEWKDPCLAPAIVVAGHQISKDTSEAKWKFILSHDEIVFARTSPIQKLLIVGKFKELEKEIVAVTGDGVNDAPALKRADIGVAMGVVGTEVAREAADMILLDDNFASIVRGVEEGRLIFDNLKKSIAYTLSSNIPEISPFLCFITVRTPLPLSTVLILCIDLGTDMVPAISMAWERAEADIMRRPPRNSSVDRLVTRKLVVFAYLQIGVIQATAGFFTWMVVLNDYGYTPGILAGLGSYDNWGKQILYCKTEGGVFRTIDGAGVAVADGVTASLADMETLYGQGNMFWDPSDNGVVIGCQFASKNLLGDLGSSIGDLNRAVGSTMVNGNNDVYTAELSVVTKQSIDAMYAGGYYEFMPWRARNSPFWDADWVKFSATDEDGPGLGDVDGTLSFAVQNIGYFDVSGFSQSGTADGENKANDLLQASLGNDGMYEKANWFGPDSNSTYTGSRKYGHSFTEGGSTYINIASRMMQKEALHHAQCAYFVSIVVVQWADLMICKTRWLSIYHQGMMNPAMNFGLVFETILAAYICYTPGVGAALGTRPIRLTHWAPAVPFSICIFLYDEIRKKIMRDNSPIDTSVVSKQVFLNYGWLARQTYY